LEGGTLDGGGGGPTLRGQTGGSLRTSARPRSEHNIPSGYMSIDARRRRRRFNVS